MGGRAARAIAITLVILVVLLVAADRIGVYIAERTAGSTIQSSQKLGSRPDVDITGFPFLTQLAAGKFDEIIVTAKNVPVDKNTPVLDISRLRVVLHTITVSRDFSRVHADTANATATITFDDLHQALGLDVSYAGNGRIRATERVSVGGTAVSATLTTQPALVNGALTFTRTAVNGAGQLSQAATSALTKVFDVTVPLQGLPFKVRVTSLRVDKGGVLIDLSGKDLTYTN